MVGNVLDLVQGRHVVDGVLEPGLVIVVYEASDYSKGLFVVGGAGGAAN